MRTRIKSRLKLSKRGYQQCGGYYGDACWWLKREWDGEHMPIGDLRGDEHIDLEVDLATGKYTLGTGFGKDAIRQRVDVPEPKKSSD